MKPIVYSIVQYQYGPFKNILKYKMFDSIQKEEVRELFESSL